MPALQNSHAFAVNFALFLPLEAVRESMAPINDIYSVAPSTFRIARCSMSSLSGPARATVGS
jgi:hypothetical protein